MIDRTFIDDLKTRVGPGDLLERYGVEFRSGRYFCPFCQPGGAHDHKTPDLSVSDEGWHCFKCDESGGDAISLLRKIETSLSFSEAVDRMAEMAGVPVEHGTVQRPSAPKPPVRRIHYKSATLRPELLGDLYQAMTALPESPGEQYLQERGFPVDLALEYGIGYATPDHCQRLGLDRHPPRLGRVIFPHYAPRSYRNDTGTVCSLYGRAVELDSYTVGKAHRHRHLSGSKGWFNRVAVTENTDSPLVICEGSFDALAFIAAGYSRTLATFGANIDHLDWLRGVESVVLALDADERGRRSMDDFARALSHRGKSVWMLEPSDYGASKDAADAWRRRELDISALIEVTPAGR